MTKTYDIDHTAEFWSNYGPRLMAAMRLVLGVGNPPHGSVGHVDLSMAMSAAHAAYFDAAHDQDCPPQFKQQDAQ